MIESFRSKALKNLYNTGDTSGVIPKHAAKIERLLFALDSAKSVDDLRLPAYRLHQLKGDLKGFWSLRVNGNWRIIFRMDEDLIYDVDLIDYH